MQNKENTQQEENTGPEQTQPETDIKAENSTDTDEKAGPPDPESEARVKELNDKFLRLYSEFDNYRKRTLKERAELIKTAAEDVFKAILPVIDDFERAIRANESIDNAQAVKEGMQLIYNKFKNTVNQKGLVSFESIGEPFDPDMMEAITHVPSEDKSQKGKVIDEVEKGYKLGDKVIRFAKVVVAQ
jgi:molecular chaperone GrpE